MLGQLFPRNFRFVHTITCTPNSGVLHKSQAVQHLNTEPKHVCCDFTSNTGILVW